MSAIGVGGEQHRHWPGLDGLRGLAVAAVLLFHGGVSWAQGGFLGVSLFFTLSGFLITTLLLREHQASARISLGAFWARRARRLLPASFAALLLALVTVRIALPLAQRSEALGDVRAAAVNLANWRFIWRGAVYADVTRLPSPVQHYWSLAIEEQFYLLFPLVALVALRRSRAALAAVLAAVVLLSTWRQISLDDPNRVYFGTDTRIAELAIGGLLAVGRERLTAMLAATGRHLADLVGGAALVATLVLWAVVDDTAAGLYAGGLTTIAVVSAALVLGAAEGRRLPRWLGVGPLAGLGRVSYGVYLYHFPVYLLLEQGTALEGARLLVVQVAATLALAVPSYVLLERPIRYGVRLRGQRSTVAFASALGLVLLGAFVYTARLERRAAAEGLASDVVVVVGADLASATPAGSSPSSTMEPAGGSGAGVLPRAQAARAPHVLVVGDSTAEGFARGLTAWGMESRRLRVSSVTSAGCATHSGTRLRVRPGYELSPKGCDVLFPTAAATATEHQVDAVVVLIGSSQLADWTYAGSSGWHDITEPSVQADYEVALDEALATLEGAGVPVLWADLPAPAWDLDVFGEQLGGPLPGRGEVTLNDPARPEHVNRIDRRVVPRHPFAVLWPWREHLAGPDGRIAPSTRPDGLHVDEALVGPLADDWLYDLLDASYDEVVGRGPTGLRPPADHAWSSPGVAAASTTGPTDALPDPKG